jgi:Undecaprenyl-phosphate glucose phosphotransferase
MNKSRKDIYKFLAMMSDLFWVLVAWMVAYYLRFYSNLPVQKGVPEWHIYFKLMPFIAAIWLGVFSLLGVYRHMGTRLASRRRLLRVLQACVVATLCFIAVSYFYEEYKYSRITLLFYAVLHPLAVCWGRVILGGLLQRKRHEEARQKVLLIGSGQCFSEVFALLRYSWQVEEAALGAILVGTPEQQRESQEFCASNRIIVHKVPVDWVEFFQLTNYASVVFALPYQSYEFIEDNLPRIADQVLDIKLIPDIRRFTKFSSSVELVDDAPVIHIHESPLQGVGQLFKRMFDVLGAVVALLLFAPVMLIIGLLVKCSSRGPVFYQQERMGLDGRGFAIFKFRTMAACAEADSGAVWAVKNDQRTTRLGGVLRRTSLDELPQLFNVLRGEMSLVGPRPERPVFVATFRKNVPGYMLRHKVKAGITGWAQVNGWRGNTSIEKRIEYDLFYIQHWSLWLDIKILFLTVFKGFVNPNAY